MSKYSISGRPASREYTIDGRKILLEETTEGRGNHLDAYEVADDGTRKHLNAGREPLVHETGEWPDVDTVVSFIDNPSTPGAAQAGFRAIQTAMDEYHGR